MRTVIFGGTHGPAVAIARELARLGATVTFASLHSKWAAEAAQQLGPRHRFLAADACDLESCLAAVEGQDVALAAVGDSRTLGRALAEACLSRRCHYVDLGDDPAHVRTLETSMRERFNRAGLALVPAASAALGLTGALLSTLPLERPSRVEVTLAGAAWPSPGAAGALLEDSGFAAAARFRRLVPRRFAAGRSHALLALSIRGAHGEHRVLLGGEDGGRLVALPPALAARSLVREARGCGVLRLWEVCGARALLDEVLAQGFALTSGPAPSEESGSEGKDSPPPAF